LKKVFPYLEQLGILSYVINSSTILDFKLEEIQDRKEFLESIGEPLVINDKFNSVFCKSKKRYQQWKEQYKEMTRFLINYIIYLNLFKSKERDVIIMIFKESNCLV